MTENGKEHQQPKQQQPSSPSKSLSSRPTTITLPPRSFTETFFSSGAPGTLGFSPGPMTLLSSFFSDSDDCKSFSQLLAGAIASPNFKPPDDKSSAGDFSSSSSLSIVPPPPMFSMPLGLSPVSLPDSPGFGLFSPQVIKCSYTDCISCLLTLFFCTLFLPEKVFVFFAFFFFNFNLITEKGIKN
jgi:hypothetical protein